MDDAELIALARQGDVVAFSRLFSEFERSIFRYASHMCGRDAADDIVQETFLALLRPSTSLRARGSRYDPQKGSAGSYLFGIARHFVLRRLGGKDAATFALDEDDTRESCADEGQPSVLDSLSRAETIQAVRAAIATLPAPYREVIVLCELQEMSYAAAAAVAQCPVGTVRSRLHRAKDLLMAKLVATDAIGRRRPSGRPAEVEVALRKTV